jgi:hypothetical protein
LFHKAQFDDKFNTETMLRIHAIMNQQRIASIIFVALLTGCADKAHRPAFESLGATCGNLQFVQRGQTVLSNGNFVSLTRSPFLIYFLGEGTDPTFHASQQQSLAVALQKSGQPEIWNMAGNGMATEDEEIFTRDDFAILSDENLRTKYAAQLGRNYPAILRLAIASRPDSTLLTQIPQNPFRYFDNATHRQLSKVSKINGQNIENTTMPSIFLVSFAIQERVAPLLYRSSWKPCELRFPPQ